MNAKEMHDAVTLEVYDGSDNKIDLYSEKGVKVEGAGFTFSLAEYFEAQASDPSATQALKDLAEATLVYGSYAQIVFKYDVGTIGTLADITDVTAETLESHRMTKTGDIPTDLTFMGITLILETETTLCLYFKAEDMSQYSFVLDGVAVTPEEVADQGLYCIRITNIAAKDLDAKHELVINGSCTLSFEALSYAYTVLRNGTNKAELNVVKALYKYNLAANAYFGE